MQRGPARTGARLGRALADVMLAGLLGREWLLDSHYATRSHVAALRRPLDPTAYREGLADRAPIVLLPGIYEDWQFLHPLADLMHELGHPTHAVVELRRTTTGIERGAEIVAAELERLDLRGAVLLAHSKGGLIGKKVMLGPSGWRVARLVAIATPFSGSEWGDVLPVRAIRALAPSAPDVLALAAETAVNARITSIYPLFDPHVPGGSELPGAENVRLPVTGHSRILADPIALRAVGRAVAGAAERVERAASS